MVPHRLSTGLWFVGCMGWLWWCSVTGRSSTLFYHSVEAKLLSSHSFVKEEEDGMDVDTMLLPPLQQSSSMTMMMTTTTTPSWNSTRLSRVMVHIPASLHNASGNIHMMADYGPGKHLFSSGRMAEAVYFTPHNLCRPIENVSATWLFPQPTNNRDKAPTAFAWPTRHFILMSSAPPGSADPVTATKEHGLKQSYDDDDDHATMDEKQCSFVTMTRHAQQVGASALILAYPHCLCSQGPACTDAYVNSGACHKELPRMINDGSAGDVSIPTFLLEIEQSEKIKAHVKQHQSILMELAWGISPPPVPDDEKEKEEEKASHPLLWYHLWMSARDPILDYDTMVNLKIVATAFEREAGFAPRYMLIDGRNFNCPQSGEDNGPCDHLCTNQGRYCALHGTNLSGHAIVSETLRSLCVWEVYGEIHDPDSKELLADKKPHIWWDYVLHHRNNCFAPHSFADPDCIRDAMHLAGVDQSKVEHCMSESGALDKDGTNVHLENMLTEQSKSGITSWPALTVNHKPLDYVSSFTLYDTICSFYYESMNIKKLPEMCELCFSCPNKVGCLTHRKCVPFSADERHLPQGDTDKQLPEKKTKKRSGWSRFFWFVAVSGIIGGGVWYYLKMQREQFGSGGGGMGEFGAGGGGAGLLNSYMQLGSND